MGVEHLHPEWNSLEEESVDNTLDIFKFDSLKSSHAVVKYIVLHILNVGHINFYINRVKFIELLYIENRCDQKLQNFSQNSEYTVIEYLQGLFSAASLLKISTKKTG